MTRLGLSAVSFLAAVVALSGATVALAQAPQTPPPLILESLTGRDSFERYCAACHGRTGLGDGPVAEQLRTAPANLTTLARRSGGTFPRARVAAYVDGSSRSTAHGSSDMPLWGLTFRALDPSDVRVRVRLANLVAYVESLQLPDDGRPAAVPVERPDGAQLFRTHCAACHGTSGRGDGPMVLQLRRVPRDLTQYTARNGGVYPSEAVRRIVDGRDVPAHGDPAMPIWGDVFLRSTGSTEIVRARIQALVDYLASIQERTAE